MLYRPALCWTWSAGILAVESCLAQKVRGDPTAVVCSQHKVWAERHEWRGREGQEENWKHLVEGCQCPQVWATWRTYTWCVRGQGWWYGLNLTRIQFFLQWFKKGNLWTLKSQRLKTGKCEAKICLCSLSRLEMECLAERNPYPTWQHLVGAVWLMGSFDRACAILTYTPWLLSTLAFTNLNAQCSTYIN